MRIKLNQDLPVDAKHGAKKDRVFEAELNKTEGRSRVYWWIEGDAGERVGVLSHEADEVVEGES